MDGHELASQFTSAAIVVYVLRYLRSMPWFQHIVTRIPVQDATIHRVLSLVCAAVAAMGVHSAFEGNAQTGWHVALTIPPAAALVHGLWDWLRQFCMQQLAYDAVVNKTSVDGQ